MQYFKPNESNYFVGDAMPFWHEGRFHLYYLLDEGHHTALGGGGGHQWAHASTTDLVHWEHHPLAIALGAPGEVDELSICTGSLFAHEGIFYAFYAGRRRDAKYGRVETVCLATSPDGIEFTKSPDNPIIVPDEAVYGWGDFRDPNVFCDDEDVFHMLVTGRLAEEPVHAKGGVLAHLTSRDLAAWEFAEPFLIPGVNATPECPDYFRWNDWYYVTFLTYWGRMHYRMSREPFGPWLRPEVDTLEGCSWAAAKTAAFGDDRRLAVGFLPWRADEKDDGGRQYAGNAVFREITQSPDGTLGARFPEEMLPATGEMLDLAPAALSCNVEGLTMAMLEGVPPDSRITARIVPAAETREFGLVVRGHGRCEGGYEVRFIPRERRVTVKPMHVGDDVGQSVLGVTGLDQPFTMDLVMKGDIIDLCVGGRTCFVNRYPEQRGERLFLFSENGTIAFEDIEIRPLVG